jgi:hypothetical protein
MKGFFQNARIFLQNARIFFTMQGLFYVGFFPMYVRIFFTMQDFFQNARIFLQCKDYFKCKDFFHNARIVIYTLPRTVFMRSIIGWLWNVKTNNKKAVGWKRPLRRFECTVGSWPLRAPYTLERFFSKRKIFFWGPVLFTSHFKSHKLCIHI